MSVCSKIRWTARLRGEVCIEVVIAYAGRDESEIVEGYLSRISDAESIEEKQDAAAELRDLLEGRPEVTHLLAYC